MLSNMLWFLTSSIVVPGENGEMTDYSNLAEYTLSEEYANLVSGASASPPMLIVGLCVALAVICVGLVVIILMQKKRASGIGAALSGTGETYWSKNKGKSVEGTLERYTKWGAVGFILIALAINILI